MYFFNSFKRVMIIGNRRRFESTVEGLRGLWISYLLSRDMGLDERFYGLGEIFWEFVQGYRTYLGFNPFV